MSERLWQFFIDVGGTFTDVVAHTPNNQLTTHKLLSSGVIRGTVQSASPNWIQDDRRILDPVHGWVGYNLTIINPISPHTLGARPVVIPESARAASVISLDVEVPEQDMSDSK